MNLPESFIERMKEQLGDEAEEFFASFEKDFNRGLRVNTLKISVDEFLKISPFKLEPIPWTDDGFYYNPEELVTKHPHYYAGLYYIQEPSAMAPVNVLLPEEGDVVLDLCAAPGGKTTQIASMLRASGLIVSNDINNNRVKAIVRNIEKYGIKNSIVLNADQRQIASKLGNIFDKILIDAPCSGEGMFRKDKKAVAAWKEYSFDQCAKLQREIIDYIPSMIKAQGQIVYSTCTYNREENEEQIDYLIREHNFMAKDINSFEKNVDISVDKNCGRIWPHKQLGEGHFLASLIYDKPDACGKDLVDNDLSTAPEELSTFVVDNLKIDLKGKFKLVKENLYLLPQKFVDLKGLRIAREGWLVGTIKRGRFVPHQSFAMGLKMSEVKNTINLSSESIEVIKYLKCETIKVEGNKGWNLVCVDGYPLGWGKHDGNNLKNYYPASWRME